jgi:uncharacterized protein (TIGR01244 family)
MLLCIAAGASAAESDVLATLPGHVKVGEHLHGSAQPSAESLTRLRAAGVTTVIDLRPDAETPDLDEKALVEASGVVYRSLPIAGKSSLTKENVKTFDRLLAEPGDGEVLMHCASGNRVGAMMALRARWVQGKSADEAMAIGKAAGMTGLTADVRNLVEAEPVSPSVTGGASK